MGYVTEMYRNVSECGVDSCGVYQKGIRMCHVKCIGSVSDCVMLNILKVYQNVSC